MKKPFHHHLLDYFFPHPRNNHRPHIFSALSVAVLVLAVITFEAGYLVQTRFVFLKTDFLAAVLPSALIALTNEDRTAYGLQEVTESALLSIAAQTAAEDMAAGGYFSHVSPDGKNPWYWLNQAGYRYSYAGQNLAVNFTDSEIVQTAWMASPTHRANIVKREYTEVGFGTAHGMYEGRETTFVVEFFATPAAPAPAPIVIAVAEPSPIEALTSTAPVQVLGSETVAPVPAASVVLIKKTEWLASLLASPLNTLLVILSILFLVVAISFMAALLMRHKVHHPSVVFGGTFLLLLIIGAMLTGASLAGSVQLPTDSQAASIYLSVP